MHFLWNMCKQRKVRIRARSSKSIWHTVHLKKTSPSSCSSVTSNLLQGRSLSSSLVRTGARPPFPDESNFSSSKNSFYSATRVTSWRSTYFWWTRWAIAWSFNSSFSICYLQNLQVTISGSRIATLHPSMWYGSMPLGNFSKHSGHSATCFLQKYEICFSNFESGRTLLQASHIATSPLASHSAPYSSS